MAQKHKLPEAELKVAAQRGAGEAVLQGRAADGVFSLGTECLSSVKAHGH